MTHFSEEPIDGEECTFCKKEARDEELESEGVKPTWEIQDKKNRPYCSANCRIEQLIVDGHPREHLKKLYEALALLADVTQNAWWTLEEAGVEAIGIGQDEDHRYKFAAVKEFRNGVYSLLNELGPEDDCPKWLTSTTPEQLARAA